MAEVEDRQHSCDVEGILWYWGPRSWYDIRKDTDGVWEGLVKAVRELKDLHPFLVQRPTERDVVKLHEPLRAWTCEADGRRVFALINPLPEVVAATMNLGSFSVDRIRSRQTGQVVELQAGRIKPSLEPNAVHVYGWTLSSCPQPRT